ncbi:MAG: 4-(cytidine 5'-diphospho)-2-C-methyl-D-erythritol kinase [Acutalibacteraceae bacterium]
MKVTVKAYAKINLLLDILGTLENGYHDLYMMMQSVGIYDTVTVETNDSKKISIFCDVSEIPTDEKNIAYKAATAFFEYTEIQSSGIHIDIKKKIPHAAGLAGGSADGAAVVRALQRIYKPDLTDRDIIEICSRFGSDVPFCALGGTMLAQGTGTILTYMPQLKLPNIVIVKPECSVATGPAYRAFDTAEHVRHPDNYGMFKAVNSLDTNSVFQKVDNVFEQFIDVPERIEIKSVMRTHHALCTCMSGSGPSVFGIFENEADAKECAERLKKTFKNTFLCGSKEKGCEIVSITE